MNLQPVYPPDTHGQCVTCCQCGARTLLNHAMADLDGPAFAAYWCARCVAEKAASAPARDSKPTATPGA